VKVLRPEHHDDLARISARWAEQAELLRFVSHPSVVGVREHFEGHPPHVCADHRAGPEPDPAGRALYLVMNWVSGHPLRDWLLLHPGREGTVTGLRLLGQVAEVLEMLHAGRVTPSGRPVVHGDLSPGNIMVGDEGLVGISVFMGGHTTPSRAVVQSAGRGYRLKADSLMLEFNRNGPVLHLLLRYTQALITQMAQTAVCNRHHSLDQQLCRWLLLSLDRLNSKHLVMTQELISDMLGVRREGVTDAAHKLQKAGVIRYSRGRITVLDRPGLEQLTCECYAVVKREYDRLLPSRAGSEAFE